MPHIISAVDYNNEFKCKYKMFTMICQPSKRGYVLLKTENGEIKMLCLDADDVG